MQCHTLTFNIRLYFAPHTISQKSLKNPQLFFKIKLSSFLKRYMRYMSNLFCGGTFWLLGSRPAECFFFHCKYSAESLWRMSWSASKHLERRAGMRDTLLWKLKVPRCASLVNIHSSITEPSYLSVSKFLLILLKAALPSTKELKVSWVGYFREYLMGWLNWCLTVSVWFWHFLMTFPAFAQMGNLYSFHHNICLRIYWKQTQGLVSLEQWRWLLAMSTT